MREVDRGCGRWAGGERGCQGCVRVAQGVGGEQGVCNVFSELISQHRERLKIIHSAKA